MRARSKRTRIAKHPSALPSSDDRNSVSSTTVLVGAGVVAAPAAAAAVAVAVEMAVAVKQRTVDDLCLAIIHCDSGFTRIFGRISPATEL